MYPILRFEHHKGSIVTGVLGVNAITNLGYRQVFDVFRYGTLEIAFLVCVVMYNLFIRYDDSKRISVYDILIHPKVNTLNFKERNVIEFIVFIENGINKVYRKTRIPEANRTGECRMIVIMVLFIYLFFCI